MKGAVNIGIFAELVTNDVTTKEFTDKLQLVPKEIMRVWIDDFNQQVIPLIIGFGRIDYLEAIIKHSPELADRFIIPNMANAIKLDNIKLVGFMLDNLVPDKLQEAIDIANAEYPKGIPLKILSLIKKAESRIEKHLAEQNEREEKEILNQIEKGEVPQIINVYIQKNDQVGINRIFDTICKESNSRELTNKFLNLSGITDEQIDIAIQNSFPFIVKNNKMNIFAAILGYYPDALKQAELAYQATILIKDKDAVQLARTSKEKLQNFGNTTIEDQITEIENKTLIELVKVIEPDHRIINQLDIISTFNQALQEHIKSTQDLNRTKEMEETKEKILDQLLNAKTELAQLQSVNNKKFADAFQKLSPSLQFKYADMLLKNFFQSTNVNSENVIRFLNNIPSLIADEVLQSNLDTIDKLYNKDLIQALLARNTNFANLYLTNINIENDEIRTLVNLVDQVNKGKFEDLGNTNLPSKDLLAVARLFTTNLIKANDIDNLDKLFANLSAEIRGIVIGDNIENMLLLDNTELFLLFYDNIDLSQGNFFLHIVNSLAEPGSKIKNVTIDLLLEKKLESHIGKGEWNEYLDLINNKVHPESIRERYSTANVLARNYLTTDDIENIIKAIPNSQREQLIREAFDKLINANKLDESRLKIFLIFTKPNSELEKHIIDICQNDPLLKDKEEIKSAIKEQFQIKVSHHKKQLTDEEIDKQFGKEMTTLYNKMFDYYNEAKEQMKKNGIEAKELFTELVLTKDLGLNKGSQTYKYMCKDVKKLFDLMIEDRKDRGTLEKVFDAIKKVFGIKSISVQFQEHVDKEAQNTVKSMFREKIAYERAKGEDIKKS